MSYPSSLSSFENRKPPLLAFAVQQTVAGSQSPQPYLEDGTVS